MKTMTCREMGGMCDTAIKGSSLEEMMGNGMAHIEQSHPDMASNIKAMPETDPKMVAWYKKFVEDYTNTPDDN